MSIYIKIPHLFKSAHWNQIDRFLHLPSTLLGILQVVYAELRK